VLDEAALAAEGHVVHGLPALLDQPVQPIADGAATLRARAALGTVGRSQPRLQGGLDPARLGRVDRDVRPGREHQLGDIRAQVLLGGPADVVLEPRLSGDDLT